jgi:hypothetical protein
VAALGAVEVLVTLLTISKTHKPASARGPVMKGAAGALWVSVVFCCGLLFSFGVEPVPYERCVRELRSCQA